MDTQTAAHGIGGLIDIGHTLGEIGERSGLTANLYLGHQGGRIYPVIHWHGSGSGDDEVMLERDGNEPDNPNMPAEWYVSAAALVNDYAEAQRREHAAPDTVEVLLDLAESLREQA